MLSNLRGSVFDSLFNLKSNSPKRKYWQELEDTQHLPHAKLKEIQSKRWLKLWDFLWQHNSYYRKRFSMAGIEKTSIKCLDDITALPLLTKQDVRESTDDMISQGYTKSELLHFSTGGSTGKALDLYVTEKCSELRNACARRHDRWTGWEPGEPIGAAWGNPKLPKSFKEKLYHHLLQPYIYLDTMAVSRHSVLEFIECWKKVKPTLLYGHAHSLFILAQNLLDLGCTTLRPKGILSTSMMLLPHERDLIEKVFSRKVTDRYGCEEVSLIGCECEKHEGLHMNIEHLIIEFIKDDGTIALPGESGNIVVTDLMNYAMPFVRYKVEDIGIPLDAECSCGRGLPLMGKVTGRVADFLLSKKGEKVAGISLIENTLTKMPGINQMQIIQESIDEILINIVPGREFDSTTHSLLKDYIKEIFPDTFVKIRKTKEILPEPSGKYRFSICRIPNEK